MARRYGRSPRGERLVAAVPDGHWKTSTFLAGLRYDGLVAPCVIADALRSFSPDECTNYLANAGYPT